MLPLLEGTLFRPGQVVARALGSLRVPRSYRTEPTNGCPGLVVLKDVYFARHNNKHIQNEKQLLLEAPVVRLCNEVVNCGKT